MKTNININTAVNFITNQLSELMEVACAEVEGDMVLRASGSYGNKYKAVDLGNYMSSFNHEVSKDGTAIIGTISNSAEYAKYIEFGTGEFAEGGVGRKGGWIYKNPKTNQFVFTLGMKPRPIMRDSLKAKEKKVRKILGVK